MQLNMLQLFAKTLVTVDNQPITYLKGSAGTGKSFTVSSILSSYSGTAELTASTHKAKSVLSRLTEQSAITTQSYFGYTLTYENYKQVLTKRPNHRPKKCDLLVIDEISMLPNCILLDAIAGIGRYYSQLLIIGDAIQLPAVSDAPDFSLIEPYAIELTQQMRQQPDPTLVAYLQSYRDSIINNSMPSLAVDSPSVTLIDDHATFCETYLSTTGNKKILAYRNKVVDAYNKHLVSGDDYNIGDEVVINKQLGNYINNQDIVYIHQISNSGDYYNITVQSTNGALASCKVFKSKSLLNSKLQALKDQDNEQAYWALFNSAVELKHIYASTVHKMQGESTSTIFIDALDMISSFQSTPNKYNNPLTQDMFLRLLYVAISRMQTHCYIFTGNTDGTRNYAKLKT